MSKKITIIVTILLFCSFSLFAQFTLGAKVFAFSTENIKGIFGGGEVSYAPTKMGLRPTGTLALAIAPSAKYKNADGDWVITEAGKTPFSYRTYMLIARLGVEYYTQFANGFSGGGTLYVSARDTFINTDGDNHSYNRDWGRQSFLTYGIGAEVNCVCPFSTTVALTLKAFATYDISGVSWKAHSVKGEQSSYGTNPIGGGFDAGISVGFRTLR